MLLPNLAPVDPNWQATGALFRPPQPTDFRLELLEENILAREAGLPQSFLFMPMEQVPGQIKINQGSVPKCVASSTAIDKSLQEFKDIGQWQRYDDDEVYRAAGGNGSNGVDTQRVLDLTREPGLRVVGTERRYKIASYMFAPQSPRLFRETLCAAVMTTGPCVVATLLPQSFGWTSSGQKTNGYHQMELFGWEGLEDTGWAVFLNTWGESFGNRGFVRLPWGYLEEGGSFQGRYVYAYTIADFRDNDTIPPVPTPDPTPTPNPDWEREIIRLVNQHRQSIGRTPLAEHPALMQSARAKSRDMGVNGYFGHEHNGQGPVYWMQQAGLQNPTVWGENIAAGQPDPGGEGIGSRQWGVASGIGPCSDPTAYSLLPTPSPQGAFTDWLNSPGHRANIEFPGFTHIGVGYQNISPSQYGTYWTQHFAGLSGPQPDPEPNPNPEPQPAGVQIRAKATGGGLEMLRVGLDLQAAGGGFSGSLSVSEVVRDPTPNPDPNPNPNPNPDPNPNPNPNPDPGPLPVRALGRRRVGSTRLSVWGYVSLPAGATSATVRGAVNGQALPAFTTGSNGIATWVVSAAAPAVVELSAEAGGITGGGTWRE